MLGPEVKYFKNDRAEPFGRGHIFFSHLKLTKYLYVKFEDLEDRSTARDVIPLREPPSVR